MKKKTLTVLVYGDIFGKLGRKGIKETIGTLKKKYQPDLTIANIENSTHGSGFSAKTLEEVTDAGVDFCTGGDHSLDNKNGRDVLQHMQDAPVIRPANMNTKAGDGHRMLDINGHTVLVINLLGRLYIKRQFMNSDYTNPFMEIDTILNQYKDQKPDVVIVDFHAETTSEKASFAYHVDGKASLVYGTHTHVPTADERILPNGTGFITDIGFVGPHESVIGINPEDAVRNYKKPIKTKISIVESGPVSVNGIIAKINTQTGACISIKRFNETLTN